MVNDIEEHGIHCPYCDEHITVLVDLSLPEQRYIEDCEVCCRPITLTVAVDVDGDAMVRAGQEDE